MIDCFPAPGAQISQRRNPADGKIYCPPVLGSGFSSFVYSRLKCEEAGFPFILVQLEFHLFPGKTSHVGIVPWCFLDHSRAIMLSKPMATKDTHPPPHYLLQLLHHLTHSVI
ncbi:uncharacterized protein J3R85_017985 [Psidium guajava]|nr:uncharacterized protein J3R85_017985 [Psidium guajava]